MWRAERTEHVARVDVARTDVQTIQRDVERTVVGNAIMRTVTLMHGICVHTVRLRPAFGVALGMFPGRGAPTRWSEITGFPARHDY
jgi:hypothetical protein